MRLKIDNIESSLNNLFIDVSKIEDNEIKSHLSKYLCLQASAYLENVIKTLISTYLDGTCPKPAESYIVLKVDSITNLDEVRLSNFLKLFSSEWENKFKKKLTDSQKASLNSIISQRNQIAHGKQSNISFSIIDNYYKDLKEIVIILKEIIRKN
jgi:hypothetical protein